MTGFTQTLEKPKLGPPVNKIPLQHLICKCQEPLPSGTARCGAKVTGPLTFLTLDPKRVVTTVCVVCHDLRFGGVPCTMCGKVPAS